MNSFIGADQSWVLWAIIAGWVALSIDMEQRFQWASKVSGAIIALVGALVLSNFNIIPTSAPVYDIVWDYVVPLAIPLLLLQCDIRKIGMESGRLLLIFLIGSLGTVAGALLGYIALHDIIPDLSGIAGMMTGSYIGGGVNFAALAKSFSVPGEMVSATVVADNLLMALYFFVLVTIPSLSFFREHFPHPIVDGVESKGSFDGEKTLAANFWGRKDISLRDISYAGGVAFVIVALSGVIASFLGRAIPDTNVFMHMLNIMLSNQYLIITTLSMICATLKPDFFGEIRGAQEIGTYLIYFFFFVIGVPASIPLILTNSPMLLVFCGIMVLTNMVVIFGIGKLLHFDLEEIILASNANIGGPTTAMAMAISKGWVSLVGPTMLVGTLGYVIGTYLGIFVGNLLF